MKYVFTQKDREAINQARKMNHDKQIEKRLLVLVMRFNGKTQKEIAGVTGFARSHVCNLIRKYFDEGLDAVAQKHYHGNRRNLSIDEETAFLAPYREQAEQGHILDVKEIKIAYEKRVGHRIGNGQIYRVLKRHGWRKVMPRSRHPKKADNETIAISKKLSQE